MALEQLLHTHTRNIKQLNRSKAHSNYIFSHCLHLLLSAFALLFVFSFAYWWFIPQHVPHNFFGTFRVFDILLFLLVSYIIWHPIIMEVLTWCISSHMKNIRKEKPAQGLKVAFITTIV